MVRSASARVAGALLAAAAAGSCKAGVVSRPDSPVVPAAWTVAGPRAGDTTAILWAFRSEDCMSCLEVDYDLRRVQARFGSAVPLLAVHVGSVADSLVLIACLRTRRLRADRAVTVSPRAFREMYPEATLPGLYLLQGRRIAWSAASQGGAQTARVQLDTLVRRLRAGLEPTGGRGPGSAGERDTKVRQGVLPTRTMREDQ